MTEPRRPPRFVPTLTAVLEPAAAPPAPLQAPAVPAASASTAPAATAVDAVALDLKDRLSEMDVLRLEEQLLHRVLQRVDCALEERLTDTVSAAVQQQLDQMIPALRARIEAVLRATVIDALAQELSEHTGSVPPFDTQRLG